MGKFFLKCVISVFLLFIGVLIGMEKANEGMRSMKGYEDTSLPSPVHLKKGDDGNMEAALLGNEVHSMETLEDKKKKLEEMESFNFFSSLGRALGNTVTNVTQKLVDLFVS
ncbi:YqxA family protein [Siminovitchia sp. FSL H7-0308]|uniref:Glycerate-2-kinase n=1 Tax=Siminovitchia thermophila TaxID=1245522 RepID=A0ABS2R9N6_9BACI|nr:YqxA family protein [Siminovitchia thermophila]MBM7716324.1 glycerate-2-kinase [Siminovitchia thermophila]ONK24185.1 hypothetical protein BLX87_06835 [Bacillus sp. VT-16-64]